MAEFPKKAYDSKMAILLMMMMMMNRLIRNNLDTERTFELKGIREVGNEGRHHRRPFDLCTLPSTILG